MSDGTQISRERRRLPRVQLAGAAGTLQFRISVRIHDLSCSGVAFETEQPPSLRGDHHLKFSFGSLQLGVVGRVVRCRLAATRKVERSGEVVPLYRAAMSFSEISQSLENLLVAGDFDCGVESPT